MEFSSTLLRQGWVVNLFLPRSVEEVVMASWPELGAGQVTAEGSGSTASPRGGCGTEPDPALQL